MGKKAVFTLQVYHKLLFPTSAAGRDLSTKGETLSEVGGVFAGARVSVW